MVKRKSFKKKKKRSLSINKRMEIQKMWTWLIQIIYWAGGGCIVFLWLLVLKVPYSTHFLIYYFSFWTTYLALCLQRPSGSYLDLLIIMIFISKLIHCYFVLLLDKALKLHYSLRNTCLPIYNTYNICKMFNINLRAFFC